MRKVFADTSLPSIAFLLALLSFFDDALAGPRCLTPVRTIPVAASSDLTAGLFSRSVSYDGSKLLAHSSALGATVSGVREDGLYTLDLSSGVASLASVLPDGTSAKASRLSYQSALSGDGQLVAFVASDGDEFPTDSSLYLRRVPTAVTFKIASHPFLRVDTLTDDGKLLSWAMTENTDFYSTWVYSTVDSSAAEIPGGGFRVGPSLYRDGTRYELTGSHARTPNFGAVDRSVAGDGISTESFGAIRRPVKRVGEVIYSPRSRLKQYYGQQKARSKAIEHGVFSGKTFSPLVKSSKAGCSIPSIASDGNTLALACAKSGPSSASALQKNLFWVLNIKSSKAQCIEAPLSSSKTAISGDGRVAIVFGLNGIESYILF